MSGVIETEAFKKQRGSSLNNLINKASTWTVDAKYIKQATDAIERVKIDLEDGIILKLQAERQKNLEEFTIKNCFQNKSYNYLQALKCEQFHHSNDFKQNLLASFFTDHLGKHLNEYEQCYASPEFT